MSPASPPVREFSSTDPDTAEAFLRHHYALQTLHLSGNRRTFSFVARHQVFGHTAAETIRHSMTARAETGPSEDYFVVRSLGGPVTLANSTTELRLRPGELALVGAGEAHEVCWDDVHFGLLRLRAALVRSVLDELGYTPQHVDLRQPVNELHSRHWLSVIRFVQDAVGHASSGLVGQEVDRLLVTTTLATFGVGDQPRRTPTEVTSASLRRAVRYIEGNADQAITIADVASAARVTPRAIQQAFRRHLDTTPTLFIRRVRLDCAHTELSATEPGTGRTVAEVSARWGFSHPGRFATAYRSQFGLPPSATLNNDVDPATPEAKPQDA